VSVARKIIGAERPDVQQHDGRPASQPHDTTVGKVDESIVRLLARPQPRRAA
jgi:hypothetical protein